jgi:hypothetical protein
MNVEVTGAYETYLLVCMYMYLSLKTQHSLKHRGSQLPLTWGPDRMIVVALRFPSPCPLEPNSSLLVSVGFQLRRTININEKKPLDVEQNFGATNNDKI